MAEGDATAVKDSEYEIYNACVNTLVAFDQVLTADLPESGLSEETLIADSTSYIQGPELACV